MHGGVATLKRLHLKRPSSPHVAFLNRGASGLFEDKFVTQYMSIEDNKVPICLLCLVACASASGMWKSPWSGKGVDFKGIAATNTAYL